ncbi:universal stress protein [Haloarchaeobius sp. TZWSO28]|uniref:universal stress protein n=1 Tax=Haloarchaeobius sp. TZWSO28 TaxID=3446119 RepID=UPI003EBD0203
MFDSILIGTDGADGTRSAIAHGLGLADTYGATVHALSVVDTSALALDDDGYDDGHATDVLRQRSNRAVEDIERQATDRGLDVVPAIAAGRPARQILRYADEHDVDLIVMGTRGRKGLARHVLGSVAESVISRSTHPVLTSRATVTPVDPVYDDILLPTDGSAQAARVAEHTFDIAAHYDATVHVFSVIDSSLIQSQELLASLESESEQAVSEMKARGKQAGADVVTRVWRGEPDRCITTYAEAKDIDLITMGTHNRRGLDRFLTATVTERVLRRAPCPVFSLRRESNKP